MADQLLDIKIQGQKRVLALVNLLKLSDTEQQKLLKKLAKKARQKSQKHRREQKTPDGQKWEKRRKGRGKMMKKLGKYLRDTANSEEARLFFNNAMVAKLAFAHHHGIGEESNSKKAGNDRKSTQRRRFGPDTEEPTNSQVQLLVESGAFRIKKRRDVQGKMRNGYKGKIPSKRWIKQNLTRGQAYAIITNLGLKHQKQKIKGHVIPRPARPWLGLSWQETIELANLLVDLILEN